MTCDVWCGVGSVTRDEVLGVWSFGFGVCGLEFEVWGLWFRVWGLGFVV